MKNSLASSEQVMSKSGKSFEQDMDNELTIHEQTVKKTWGSKKSWTSH